MNDNFSTIIKTVRILEYTAVEHFQVVKKVKLGQLLIRTYLNNTIPRSWLTELHGEIPVEVVPGVEISLVLETGLKQIA